MQRIVFQCFKWQNLHIYNIYKGNQVFRAIFTHFHPSWLYPVKYFTLSNI